MVESWRPQWFQDRQRETSPTAVQMNGIHTGSTSCRTNLSSKQCRMSRHNVLGDFRKVVPHVVAHRNAAEEEGHHSRPAAQDRAREEALSRANKTLTVQQFLRDSMSHKRTATPACIRAQESFWRTKIERRGNRSAPLPSRPQWRRLRRQ